MTWENWNSYAISNYKVSQNMRALPSECSLAEAHPNLRGVFASIGIWRIVRSSFASLSIDQSNSITNAVEELRYSYPLLTFALLGGSKTTVTALLPQDGHMRSELWP
jgi:hypothetical protein